MTEKCSDETIEECYHVSEFAQALCPNCVERVKQQAKFELKAKVLELIGKWALEDATNGILCLMDVERLKNQVNEI